MHACANSFAHEPELSWCCLNCDNEIHTEEKIQPRYAGVDWE